MADDLQLVIQCSGNSKTGSLPPVIVSRDSKGLTDDAQNPLVQKSLVVYHGPYGWVACDKRTNEVKPLQVGAWNQIAAWKLKLVASQGESSSGELSPAEKSPARESAPALTPVLFVFDGAHPEAGHRKEVLPTREGAERLLGRMRVEGRIILDDRRVSREHLRFYVEDGAVWVENLSQYPPTINGERLAGRAKLSHKDQLKIGSSWLEFSLPADGRTRAPDDLPMVHEASNPPSAIASVDSELPLPQQKTGATILPDEIRAMRSRTDEKAHEAGGEEESAGGGGGDSERFEIVLLWIVVFLVLAILGFLAYSMLPKH